MTSTTNSAIRDVAGTSPILSAQSTAQCDTHAMATQHAGTDQASLGEAASASPANTLAKAPATLTISLPPGLTFRLLHVGVAVPTLDPAAQTLATLLGYRVVSGPFDDPIQKVSVNFLAQADDNIAQIELIAPLTPDSPITSTLKKSGGGAYHLCFETNNLELALDHVKSHRCIVVSPPNPAVAFNGRRIAWFYTPNRQLMELVESPTP